MDIIRYDPEADILMIKIYDETVKNEKILDNDIILGLNEDGDIIYRDLGCIEKRTDKGINKPSKRKKG